MTETQAPTQPIVRLAPVCAAWALVGLIDGLFGAALVSLTRERAARARAACAAGGVGR